MAERLLLMQQSLEAFDKDITQDAAIKVLYEPSGKETASGQLNDFWEKLSRMYMQWAKGRKMGYEVIVKSVSPERCEFIMSIEGFAAYQVLEKEKGIHIWEQLKNENKYERIRVRVDVRTLSPEEISNKEIRGDIVKKNFDSPAPYSTKIVRSYRNKPSPLVRDNVTGWRSGKIEKILDGNFDLVE